MKYLFDKTWFAKHQKGLLFLCNSPVIKYWFRWVLRIHKEQHLPSNKKVVSLQVNHFIVEPYWKRRKHINHPRKGLILYKKDFKYHRKWIKKYGYKMPNKPWFKADFRTHNKFSKRIFYTFYPIWWLFHQWDMFIANPLRPSWNLGFDTLTVFPNESSGATSVDGIAGNISRTDLNTEIGWDSLLAATGDFARTTGYSSGLELAFIWQGSGVTWQVFARYLATLDTSSLGSGTTINSAIWSIYGETKRDPASNTPILNLFGSTPAANNDIAGTDKANVGSTAYATQIAWASLATAAYNDFTLNATGLSNISKTSITKFSMREVTYDVGSTNPSFSTNETSFEIRTADYTGTSNDPKLVIDYTPGSSFIPKIIIM